MRPRTKGRAVEVELAPDEDDEALREMASSAQLPDTALPDQGHALDVEQQALVHPHPHAPPDHESLVARPEDLGARYLERSTQSDPSRAWVREEGEELDEDVPTDRELEIRRGGPASPSGSPPFPSQT